MIKNYIKIAWRNLLKHKGYSALNISGLTLGLLCCIFIALYIRDELSYDQYHENKDRIFRVLHGSGDFNTNAAAINSTIDYTYDVWGNAPVGPALKEYFPEVEEIVQFSGRTSMLMRHEDKVFQEENVFFADSGAFDLFSWPMVAGDPKTALVQPYSCVLTESTAKKYFGNQNPIGQTIEGGNTGGRAAEGVYQVTGVMKDVPQNSHFTFDVLLSMSSFRQSWNDVFSWWGYVDFYTYFLVKPGFSKSEFISKVPAFITSKKDPNIPNYTIDIESLNEVYLHSTAGRQPGTLGNLSNLYIFSIIGLFILCIACVNFMNLSTARSMERAKEVGIRKASGAKRSEIVWQFFGESFIIVFISAVLALLLVVVLMPFMQSLTGKYFGFQSLFTWQGLTAYTAIILTTGFLAGIYPAIILSGFKPISVLRGSLKNSASGVSFRKGLVVLQFCITIALIAGTILVFSQLDYMKDSDTGFQKEQILVLDFNHDQKIVGQLDAIKNTFLENPNVLSVSATRSIPGGYFPNAGTSIESPEGKMNSYTPAIFEVDVDFIPVLDIKMVAGRPYSLEFTADTANSLVINEAAAKLYGYSDSKNIIGKRFKQWGKEGVVIGVVKDFNYLSLHQQVEPLTLRYEPTSSSYFLLKIKSSNLQKTISDVEKTWSTVAPHRPFTYSFLDDNFNRQYEADTRFRQIFTVFSFLAIVIACLGLLGLSTYTAQQRAKEIGVRKVLGASVQSIVKMLSIDFVKLVLIASLIASPLAYWFMNNWLQDFAYHIQISWMVFLIAGLIAMAIALLTVSFQALKAAVANPVKSLRDE